jgi:hypothetical protein
MRSPSSPTAFEDTQGRNSGYLRPRAASSAAHSSSPRSVAYVVSLNVKRRRLSIGATAIAAARARPLYEVEQGSPGKSARAEPSSERTRQRLAAVFGVGRTSIQQARALVERDPVAAELL